MKIKRYLEHIQDQLATVERELRQETALAFGTERLRTVIRRIDSKANTTMELVGQVRDEARPITKMLSNLQDLTSSLASEHRAHDEVGNEAHDEILAKLAHLTELMEKTALVVADSAEDSQQANRYSSLGKATEATLESFADAGPDEIKALRDYLTGAITGLGERLNTLEAKIDQLAERKWEE